MNAFVHSTPLDPFAPGVSAIDVPDEHWPDIHDHTAQLEDAGILPDLEDCV
jgi:hypothetical protein